MSALFGNVEGIFGKYIIPSSVINRRMLSVISVGGV